MTKEDNIDLDENKVLFKWMIKNYGKRCTEYAGGCACCEAWMLYDMLLGNKELKTKCRNKKCPAWRPCGCFQNLWDICKHKK